MAQAGKTIKVFSLLISLVLLFVATDLSAHVKLVDSTPSANAQIDSTPQQLILNFEHPVMLMKLSLTDIGTDKVIDFKFAATGNLQTNHTYSLPTLTSGDYSVVWTAMGKDGHNMNGTFKFKLSLSASNSTTK